MKKITLPKILLIGFYIVFTILTLGLLILSISRPQNYLSSARMGIQTVIFATLFVGIVFLWKRFSPYILSSMKVFLPVAAAYWILLYLILVIHGNAYHVVGDYEILYISALEMADGQELSFTHYFMTYGNNVGPMLLLAGIFRLSHLVGLNEFYPALFLSTLTVIGSIWAVGELLSDGGILFPVNKVNCIFAGREDCVFAGEKNRSKNMRIPVLVFTAFCLPLYVFTGAFYTDTLSFGLGVIAVALMKLSLRKKKAWWLMIPAGVVTVLGAVWKITALIFIIAVAIVWLISLLSGKKKNVKNKEKKADIKEGIKEENKEEKKVEKAAENRETEGTTEEKYGNKIWGKLAVYALTVATLAILVSVIFRGFSIYRDAKQYANPTSAWLALGMRGNGSYSENVEFSDAVNELSSKEEKSAYIKAYMKEHANEAFSLNHILSKAQNNFAGGTFTCSDFTVNTSGHSILWELMDPGGRYYYGASGYAFSYVAMMYLLFFLGGICALIRLFQGKNGLPFMKVAADLSFFGLFLFLMIWESNNRQLYNQLPVMILATFTSAELLLSGFNYAIIKK